MATKTNDEIVSALRKWLAKPGNTPARLAAMLGYRSSETVVRWVQRKSVPSWHVDRVWRILNGETE